MEWRPGPRESCIILFVDADEVLASYRSGFELQAEGGGGRVVGDVSRGREAWSAAAVVTAPDIVWGVRSIAVQWEARGMCFCGLIERACDARRGVVPGLLIDSVRFFCWWRGVSGSVGAMAEAGSPGSQDSPHSDEYGGNHGSGDRDNSNVREQDRFLPIANISRIMKKALPANAKIAKDAKETVQECVSEFISFITSEYPLYSIPRNVTCCALGRSCIRLGSHVRVGWMFAGVERAIAAQLCCLRRALCVFPFLQSGVFAAPVSFVVRSWFCGLVSWRPGVHGGAMFRVPRAKVL